jgi:2-methylcitrate dehydratase PrpD
MTALEQFAGFLAQLGSEDMAGPEQDALKLHAVDSIGAWIAASGTAEGRALIAWRERMRRGDGVDGTEVRDDVALNCALARLSETDDIPLAARLPPGAIVVPGALTIARCWPDADPAGLVAAIVAGYEAMVRLGLAIDGPAVLYRGIWPTYFAAPFGIAAVAARLMRLGELETAHALALALTLAAPGVGYHNAPTTSRWLAIGSAARNGLTAALAAQSGLTSDLKLLESGFFANVYGITPNASALTDRLGAEPVLTQVSFKPWCAARQTMAAAQGLRDIIGEGVAVDDIAEVRVAVLPPHVKMIDHGVVAGDRASHLTSVQYQMAVAALDPAAACNVAQSPGDLSPSLRSFMARIKVAGDDALLASYPAAWPARISVATRSRTYQRLVTHVPGDPARPLSAEDISDKFHRLVAPVTGQARADDMVGRVVAGLKDRQSLVRLVDEVGRICRQARSGR